MGAADINAPGYKAAGVTTPTATQSTDIYGLGDLSGYQVYQGSQDNHYTQSNSRDPSYDFADNYYSTSDDMVKTFVGSYGSDEYNNIKGLLYGAGMYGSSTYANVLKGDVTNDTDAYVTALSGYQKLRESGWAGTFAEYLKSRYDANVANGGVGDGSGGSGGGGGGGGGGGAVISYTDPEAVKQTANKAAQAAFGKEFTPDQLQVFVDNFHNAETASAYGGDQVNLSAQATKFAKEANPVEYNEHQVGLLGALWSSLAGGSSGGVSS